MAARQYVASEANLRQLTNSPPKLAILPWGATEAHNFHLPYGTDVFEAIAVADEAARLAYEQGAPLVVLPAIPFGNNEQQLDQFCTISLRTETALSILNDVCRSLKKQGVDRLMILNSHGANHFQPLVRDLQSQHDILIVLINLYQLIPDAVAEIFENAGDHAGELETSLMMFLHGELVDLPTAGAGRQEPFELETLQQPGVWTPRPWSLCHPDTGSGDPSAATGDKGRMYFETVTARLSEVMRELAAAVKGQLPYV